MTTPPNDGDDPCHDGSGSQESQDDHGLEFGTIDAERGRQLDRHCSIEAIKTSSNPVVKAVVLAHRQRIPWEKLWALAEAITAPLSEAMNCTDDIELHSVETALRAARESFERCGSPIEQIFLAYVVVNGFFEWANRGGNSEASLIGRWPYINVEIHSQLSVLSYRTDFAFIGLNRKLIVELDGHEFHERTKAQAGRDKSRDRDLQSLGWSVFRFTGSEIWRDPQRCAREVLAQFLGKEPAPT